MSPAVPEPMPMPRRTPRGGRGEVARRDAAGPDGGGPPPGPPGGAPAPTAGSPARDGGRRGGKWAAR
jgi:hypothetical protein